MLLSAFWNEREIKKELENLDPSKGCGHDNIMAKVVKQLATELSDHYHIL